MGWGVGEWTPVRLIPFQIFSVTRAHLGGLTYGHHLQLTLLVKITFSIQKKKKKTNQKTDN